MNFLPKFLLRDTENIEHFTDINKILDHLSIKSDKEHTDLNIDTLSLKPKHELLDSLKELDDEKLINLMSFILNTSKTTKPKKTSLLERLKIKKSQQSSKQMEENLYSLIIPIIMTIKEPEELSAMDLQEVQINMLTEDSSSSLQSEQTPVGNPLYFSTLDVQEDISRKQPKNTSNKIQKQQQIEINKELNDYVNECIQIFIDYLTKSTETQKSGEKTKLHTEISKLELLHAITYNNQILKSLTDDNLNKLQKLLGNISFLPRKTLWNSIIKKILPRAYKKLTQELQEAQDRFNNDILSSSLLMKSENRVRENNKLFSKEPTKAKNMCSRENIWRTVFTTIISDNNFHKKYCIEESKVKEISSCEIKDLTNKETIIATVTGNIIQIQKTPETQKESIDLREKKLIFFVSSIESLAKKNKIKRIKIKNLSQQELDEIKKIFKHKYRSLILNYNNITKEEIKKEIEEYIAVLQNLLKKIYINQSNATQKSLIKGLKDTIQNILTRIKDFISVNTNIYKQLLDLNHDERSIITNQERNDVTDNITDDINPYNQSLAQEDAYAHIYEKDVNLFDDDKHIYGIPIDGIPIVDGTPIAVDASECQENPNATKNFTLPTSLYPATTKQDPTGAYSTQLMHVTALNQAIKKEHDFRNNGIQLSTRRTQSLTSHSSKSDRKQ